MPVMKNADNNPFCDTNENLDHHYETTNVSAVCNPVVLPCITNKLLHLGIIHEHY